MPLSQPGTIRRTITHHRSRRVNPRANKPQPTSPITITAVVIAGSALNITFDQPVSLSGVPQYAVDVPGADPISAALTSPTVLQLTYDTALLGGTEVTVPFQDPAVRNASGGFVTAGVVTI